MKPSAWLAVCSNGERKRFATRKAMREYKRAMQAQGFTVSVRTVTTGGAHARTIV